VKYYITGLLLLISISSGLFSQSPKINGVPLFIQSTEIDTARLLSDDALKSPWGAVARSAVLPGWGQVYTEHYIKAVLFFSINAYFVYQIYHYEMLWRDEKNEAYRSKRNQFTWYFAAAYLLTMVDAYVDAYLYKFDDAMEIAHQFHFEEGIWISRLEFTVHF
jgi:hypothetical protein